MKRKENRSIRSGLIAAGVLLALALAWSAWDRLAPPLPPAWRDVVEQAVRFSEQRQMKLPGRIVLIGPGWEGAQPMAGIAPDRAEKLEDTFDGGLIGTPHTLVVLPERVYESDPDHANWWISYGRIHGGRGAWVLVRAPQGIP